MTVYDLNKSAAIEYAKKWAFSRNPAYYDFDGLGGDCTNFISQCVFASGAVMNYAKDTGWYYVSLNDRAAAWTGVEYFFNFMISNRSVGPFGREIGLPAALPGDIIQLGDYNGFYHSLLVVDVINGQPYVAAHTFDAFNRPLFTYDIVRLRVLRLEGARKNG